MSRVTPSLLTKMISNHNSVLCHSVMKEQDLCWCVVAVTFPHYETSLWSVVTNVLESVSNACGEGMLTYDT